MLVAKRLTAQRIPTYSSTFPTTPTPLQVAVYMRNSDQLAISKDVHHS